MSTRRRFMQIASTALGSALLPLTANAQQVAEKPPLRFLIFMDPHGMHGNHAESWIRTGSRNYALKSSDLGWALQPFTPYLENLTVVSNVSQRSRALLGGGPAHFSVNAHALTGSNYIGSRNNHSHSHPSIDVHIGNFLNKDYGLPTPRIYPNLSFGGDFSFGLNGKKSQSLNSPQAVFESVFGGNTGGGGSNAPLAAQQLVLEQVRSQLEVVRPQLNQANASTVIDAYETSLRSVAAELEIRRNLTCSPEQPRNWPAANSEAGVKATFDFIYQMFACDLVSSIKFNTPGTMKYQFIQQDEFVKRTLGNQLSALTSGNYHAVSHKGTTVAGVVQGLVHRWRNQQFASLVERLSTTPELTGSGNIMDNTVICFTSAMTHNTHKTDGSAPTFILAGKNANMKGGMHIDATGRSNNDLLVTLAQSVASPTQRFGGFNKGKYEQSHEAALNRGPFEAALKGTL